MEDVEKESMSQIEMNRGSSTEAWMEQLLSW